MKSKKSENVVEWYDNPNLITSLLIGLIALIILLSQSFAINSSMSTVYILKNILNHNSIYLLMLVYFIMVKTSIGKKYFNFLNLFLILLYLITTITSLLTIFQSFIFSALLSLALHLILIVYLVHTFLRDTRIWKEANLNKSPFNEITNNGYFYSIMVVSVILLAVNLISSVSFNGTILTLLDCAYMILFARYVFLYREFLDTNKKDSNNEGNFDKYIEKAQETVNDFIEKNDLDDKLNEVKGMVVDTTNSVKTKVSEVSHDVKDKVVDFVEDNELDDKFNELKDKVVDTASDVKKKAEEVTKKIKKEMNKKVSKSKDNNRNTNKKESK